MTTIPAGMTPEAVADAIARRDANVVYERGEFDIEGAPIVCTYRASNPFECIACRWI